MSTRSRSQTRPLTLIGASLVLPAALLVAGAPAAVAQPNQCADPDADGRVVCTYAEPGTYGFVVPDGAGDLTIAAFGAAGGAGRSSERPGGRGGSATATFAFDPGAELQVNVGGRGGDAGSRGGDGGGGRGGGADGGPHPDTFNIGAGGGGASDVRAGGTALDDRVLAAGGGGGAGGGDRLTAGGDGGGFEGAPGGGEPNAGGGGTQDSGGAGGTVPVGAPGARGTSGAGGTGGDASMFNFGSGGGGGGGHFGGGGGAAEGGGFGGGGGSGLGPDTVEFETGVRAGDGLVTITYTPALDTEPECTIDRSGATRPQVIFGTPGADVICGSGSNDAIFAGDGDDVVYGNGGNDAVQGGAGDDRLLGGAGNDALFGRGGSDTVDGGEGRDACLPGPGANPPTTACP